MIKFPGGTPNRWEKIAVEIGRSVEEVSHHGSLFGLCFKACNISVNDNHIRPLILDPHHHAHCYQTLVYWRIWYQPTSDRKEVFPPQFLVQLKSKRMLVMGIECFTFGIITRTTWYRDPTMILMTLTGLDTLWLLYIEYNSDLTSCAKSQSRLSVLHFK